MAKLTTATGVVVSVADEKAPRLLAVGYKTADEPKKAPAKKAASSKPSTSSD